MGKDFDSRFLQHQTEQQFPNAKSLKPPFDLGMPNTGTPCAIPFTNEAPMSGNLPSYGLSGQPDFMLNGRLKELHGFIPYTNHFDSLKVPCENHVVSNVSLIDPRCSPKQFLVFDRTGNQTTLIFSSMIGTPNPMLKYGNPNKVTGHYNVSGPNLSESNNTNVLSEMCEDSKDIDVLLSSDNFIEDGEETSMGCCPCTWTAYRSQHRVNKRVDNDDMDEVASSSEPSKRRKLSDISYEGPPKTYTSSFPNPRQTLEYEDDAESSCSGGPRTVYDDMWLSGTKKEKEEKIRETVSVLRSILPDGNGKDVVSVLDEAINYLKSLRFNAKSLGISGL